MTNNAPKLLVAVNDHAAVVKVSGRANFTTSMTFKRLVSELWQRGFNNFVLDLTECVTMDSTFLGVLAGTALRLSGTPDRRGQDQGKALASPLRLLNPNQRVSELLDNLGVADLFHTVHREVAHDPELRPAEEVTASREEVSRACLEAHQLLMELHPDNVSRFKDVTQFLAEDLKRLNSTPPNNSEPGEPPKSPRS